MSRIGRLPITVPAGVEVKVSDSNFITVKGPKGTLEQQLSKIMTVNIDGAVILVTRPDDEKTSRSLHGLTRTLINNMVVGVTAGYSKSLDIIGVGYKAEKKDDKLVMALGYSHPIIVDQPEGIKIEVPAPNKIVVNGADKQQVGQLAAEIRGKRAPEPYHGKGVRYTNEHIKIKAGKSGKK